MLLILPRNSLPQPTFSTKRNRNRLVTGCCTRHGPTEQRPHHHRCQPQDTWKGGAWPPSTWLYPATVQNLARGLEQSEHAGPTEKSTGQTVLLQGSGHLFLSRLLRIHHRESPVQSSSGNTGGNLNPKVAAGLSK